MTGGSGYHSTPSSDQAAGVSGLPPKIHSRLPITYTSAHHTDYINQARAVGSDGSA